MPEWLERELSRHLGSVRAPEGLWDRLQRPPAPLPVPVEARWPIAAMITFAILAGTLWLAGKAPVPVPYTLVRAVPAQQAGGTHPADWELHCTLPARTPAVRIASFSIRKLPNYAVPPELPHHIENSCFQCHMTIAN